MMDFDHYYWRWAEKWNGRLAMVGVVSIATYLLLTKL
tara:strand:- start:665 stop:775 length:111 start_codon:yes stop_codon:yes gene_type:complete